MKRLSLLPLCAMLGLCSCKSGVSPDTETGTIKGQVFLVDSAHEDPVYTTSPFWGSFSGVHVSLIGTSYSTISGDSGQYELRNIPEGTYDVLFSKQGYGDIKIFGVIVQGGGNAPIYLYDRQPWRNVTYPTLHKQTDFITILDSVSTIDGKVWLSGHYEGMFNPMFRTQIAVYFSHSANLSSTPGKYEFIECWGSGTLAPYDTVAHTFSLPISAGNYREHGFKKGDSVYFATYGAPLPAQSGYMDYYDPNNRVYVLSCANQTPSRILGTITP